MLCAIGVFSAWNNLTAAGPVKRARPPKFAQSVADVFFPDAREKLAGPRPEKSLVTPVEGAGRAPENASGPKGWSKLISAEVVEDEIKTQQIKLSVSVQNTARFKGGDFQNARLHLSLLATLFAIDAQYDGPLRWQRESPAMRNLLARAGLDCTVGSDGAYKEAKARAEDMENLVRGGSANRPLKNGTGSEPNRPSRVREVPVPVFQQAPKPAGVTAELDWPQVSNRAPLMKRLEQAQQQVLAMGTASSDAFSRTAEKLSHEAQLIAALAEVIGRDGYEFSDDETYREYCRAMQAHALELRAAVEQKDYANARQAVAEIGKACGDCHAGFRN